MDLPRVCNSPRRASVANRLQRFLATPGKVQLTWGFWTPAIVWGFFKPPLMSGVLETPTIV